MRRTTIPMTLVAVAFTAAGGWVHLREWVDAYRALPAEVPGSAVVRLGFPISAAASVAVVVVVLLTIRAARSTRLGALAGAALFQAGSLAAVVISREGSLFGWAEPVWTMGAQQAAAVAVGAILSLGAAGALLLLQREPVPVRA